MALDLTFFGFGINHFKRFPRNSLSGCVNDIVDAARYFQGRGFRVLSLLEGDATEANLKAALLALKPDGAWPENARIVIWGSTHGSQIPTDAASEHDGLSEVTVCADFDGLHGCIGDDWWHDYLSDIPASTRVYLFADWCHAGDVTRRLEAVRFLVPPQGCAAKPRLIRDAVASCVDADPSYPGILFSGCTENGTSADAWIEGRANGAFTAAALASLNYGLPMSNWELELRVNDWLAKRNFSQASRLQCGPGLEDETFLMGVAQ